MVQHLSECRHILWGSSKFGFRFLVPDKIREVSVSDVTNTSLRVTWEADPVTSVLPANTVTVRLTNQRTASSREVQASSAPVTIDQLSPYTQYNLTVSSQSRLSLTENARPRSCRTRALSEGKAKQWKQQRIHNLPKKFARKSVKFV